MLPISLQDQIDNLVIIKAAQIKDMDQLRGEITSVTTQIDMYASQITSLREVITTTEDKVTAFTLSNEEIDASILNLQQQLNKK